LSFDRIEKTGLWSNSLAPIENDQFPKEREELRSSLSKFRSNAAQLVSQVQSALPNLTQHDISHLDALWETADIICGEDFPLNPLEAFVFGGAVLLHDSALCFEAYKFGIEGVRDTLIWKDSFASYNIDNISKEEVEKSADFAALRALHANQAANLAQMNWIDPDENDNLYLLENKLLRKHLGQLIGQIAASHHWNIEEVAQNLPSQVNVPAPFPRQWRIDPQKIACMLRCADAAHIDNERAPDFLHALIKRRGISFEHWQAQNKMACADIDLSDASGTTLLFTSSIQFSETEANAWWVAYDTVCMIDKEIRSSNALLESKEVPSAQFKVKRVKGVESPELMSKYIQTKGWNPCSAEVHVDNIEHLVNSLGGEKLYGNNCDKFEVILRELVQNSRDSIHARRAMNDGFHGRITIRLRNFNNNLYLSVEDNGVGMTKRVLTGPLLGFGTSFWASSLVHNEFPGLRSSTFSAVGKFGIGFYSVFMGADKVHLSSKPWSGGNSDTWQLLFNDGLSLRPILKNIVPDDFSTELSTKVTLCLKDDILNDKATKLIRRNTADPIHIDVNICDYFKALFAGLDVSIFFSIDKSEGIEVCSGKITDDYKCEWLHNVSFANYQNEEVTNYINKNFHRLRPLIQEGVTYGMAAISTSFKNEQNFLSLKTVGGLATNLHGRSGENFIGYIDYHPLSAKREGHEMVVRQEIIDIWLKEQMNILELETLGPLERYALGSSISSFNNDPRSVVLVPVIIDKKFEFLSINELAILSEKFDIVFLKSKIIDHIDSYNQIESFEGKVLFRPIMNSSFLSLKMEGGVPEKNNSLIDCLFREIIEIGNTPNFNTVENVGTGFTGRIDALMISSSS